MRLAVLLLTVAACSSTLEVEVQDFVQSECESEPDTDPPPEALLVVGGDGTITVAHRAYPANCCVTLEPSASLDEEVATLSVEYDEEGELCDCMCAFDLGYKLVGVPGGAWTVTANQESALVTVD